MAYIHLITGGQRSGKSRYAESLAKEASEHPIYLATSRVWDDDFKKRIERHQRDRGDEWVNVEEEKTISTVDFPAGSTVVLDCITLWLTNYFTDLDFDAEAALAEAKSEWDRLIQKDITLFVVSNEIGMGVHADAAVGRHFVDLQGWMNQYIASTANQVTLMVSGVPVEVKIFQKKDAL